MGDPVKAPDSTPKKSMMLVKAEVWRPLFLAALRNSGNVRAACQAAGIDRKTSYLHRQRFPNFAKEWADALEDACDVLEAEAWQRARASSDLLLIFLLKAHRPDIYRETTRHWVSGPGGQPIEVKGKLAYEEYR